MAAFLLESLDQGVEVFHPVVDHEGGRAWSVVIAFLRIDQPGSGAGNRLARGVCPIEGGATPFLDLDSEVLPVPGMQCRSIFGFEEDAANTSDSLHRNLPGL